MIRQADLNLYKALLPGKKLTEKYVGFATFDWEWTEVGYTADCTYGVPFTMFDKAIVGILLLNDEMSLQEIGEVLGMNVIHDPLNFRLKDEAEIELLQVALDSLVEYEMTEVGDIFYSACRLTTLGKEYAEKGMKFETDHGKQFSLFYDQTSGLHEETLSNWKTVGAEESHPLESQDWLMDEGLIKRVAAVQTPQIYNPEKGNFFQDLQFNPSLSFSHRHTLWVAVLFDLDSKAYRLLAFDPQTMCTLQHASEWLEKHHLKEAVEGLENRELLESEYQKDFDQEVEKLLRQTPKLELLLQKDPQKAVELGDRLQGQTAFIDEEFFWLKTETCFNSKTEEVFFLLPQLADWLLVEIETLIRKNPEMKVFVLYGEGSEEQVQELREAALTNRWSLYFAESTSTANPCVYTSRKEKTLRFSPVEVALGSGKLPFRTLRRTSHASSELKPTLTQYKAAIASDNLKSIFERVLDRVGEELSKKKVSRKMIAGYAELAWQALPFRGPAEENIWMSKIDDAIAGLVASQKETLQMGLENQLQHIESQIAPSNISDIRFLERQQRSLLPLEKEMFPEFKEEKAHAERIRQTIQYKIHQLREEAKAKTYIIDTNVFIDSPHILSRIPKSDKVVFSITVLDELDKLKSRSGTKDAAQKAIRQIRNELKEGNGKRSRVRKVHADLSLLPEELQNKSPDNYILSLSLVLKGKNPVLLTQDKNLQNKALALDLKVMSPRDLK